MVCSLFFLISQSWLVTLNNLKKEKVEFVFDVQEYL